MLEKCLYVLQELRSIMYFQQFIHPLSLHHVAMEQALLSHLISSDMQNSVMSHF